MWKRNMNNDNDTEPVLSKTKIPWRFRLLRVGRKAQPGLANFIETGGTDILAYELGEDGDLQEVCMESFTKTWHNATVGNFNKGIRLKLHGRVRSGFKLVICDQNILFLNLKSPIFLYRIKILSPYPMEGFLLVQNINI